MAHTPTPWHFIGGESSTSSCFWIQTDCMRDGSGYIAKASWFSNHPDDSRPSKEVAKENIEFIVRCANSHAQLVEALKAARAFTERALNTSITHKTTGLGGHDGNGSSWSECAGTPEWSVRQTLEQIDNVLAAAEADNGTH